jgi:Cdc6-like AAA superfamily ATPase
VEPEEVFTPHAPVSARMFAGRPVERRLERALTQPGTQVLLFGDTGVGKTSLLNHVVERRGRKMLRIECRARRTFDELLEPGLAKFGVTAATKTTTSGATSATTSGELKVPLIGGLQQGVSGQNARTEEVSHYAVDTARRALETCRDHKIDVLAMDNFENVTDSEVRRSVGEAIKTLADGHEEFHNLKLVVVGIASTPGELLLDDVSVIRRTDQIPILRMDDTELREIIARGARLLRISIPSEVAAEIVRASDGFPYFTHLLALHLVRLARDRGWRITRDLAAEAGRLAIDEVAPSIRLAVKKAEERGGHGPRAKVLQLLANLPMPKSGDWESNELADAYRARFERDNPGKALSFVYTALGQLCQEQYGQVLKRGGRARRYTYSFTIPYLRPYLRIRDGLPAL